MKVLSPHSVGHIAIRMLAAVAQSPTGREQARLSQLSDGELAAEMAEPGTARSLATLSRELVSSWLDVVFHHVGYAEVLPDDAESVGGQFRTAADRRRPLAAVGAAGRRRAQVCGTVLHSRVD